MRFLPLLKVCLNCKQVIIVFKWAKLIDIILLFDGDQEEFIIQTFFDTGVSGGFKQGEGLIKIIHLNS